MKEHKCFVFRFADVEVKEREFFVMKAGEPLPLEPKVFRVLQFFLHHPQRLVTKAELLDAVWPDAAVTENSPARAVAQLRRALGDDLREPRFISTVATVGYRFVCPVEAVEDGLTGINGSLAMTGESDYDRAALPIEAGVQRASTTDDAVNDSTHRKGGKRFIRQPWLYGAVVTLCAVVAVVLFTGVAWMHQRPGHYKLTHLAANLGCGIVWSPDGKVIAYAREVDGVDQLFIRYLSSPVEMQLTHEPHKVYPLAWLPDGHHLMFFEPADALQSDRYKLFSVPTTGGDPEFIMPWAGAQADLSPDGKAFAIFTRGDHDHFGVQISDPVGSPFKWYSPKPFGTKAFLNLPELDFSKDGKSILLNYDDMQGHFKSFLLPYPAGSAPPRPSALTLPEDTSFTWSWMPDQRHMVASWAEEEGSPYHLWMWDTNSQERIPLTTGAEHDVLPRVSPDGSKLVFAQMVRQFDITELSLADGSATKLISTGRAESMPSRSDAKGTLAWASSQNGPFEIWVRQSDGTQRPVVTAADFPAGTNKGLVNPTISPDGNRIIYERVDKTGSTRLWMSSLSGGAPIPLTNGNAGLESGGSWSPDGQRFVYTDLKGDKAALMIVKTTGGATPEKILDSGVWSQIPNWSPVGDWIAYQYEDGWHLVSPDGKLKKSLGNGDAIYLEFSKDGKMLYGIQGGTKSDPHHLALFSLDPETLKFRSIKNLDPSLMPADAANLWIRLSLSPDGKRIVYSTFKGQSDLWLMEGLQSPDWLSRMRDLVFHRAAM